MLPAAILAGGLGTRLHPLTREIPKALVEVRGEPFIAHQLRLLRGRGLERVVLCLGHLGEQVRAFVQDGARFGLRADYSFDGPALLGTAGALRQALPLLGEAFFVLYGDSYLPCDYRAVEDAFRTAARPALMTVFRNDGQWDASNVEFEAGRILAYDKRNPTPRMRHIDYGLGVLTRSTLEAIPCPYDLAALYQDLLRRGHLAACEVHKRFYEIGSFEGLHQLEQYLERG